MYMLTCSSNLLGKFELTGIPPAPRGVPQVEVTFDMDANGIMNVTALEKGTGKTNKIVITNDKGRLSKEDIERMLADAEKHKDEDAAEALRIQAKNELEAYVYSSKSAINDESIKSKLTEEDIKSAKEVIAKGEEYVDNNTTATKDEFEAHMQEMKTVLDPIMTKCYAGADGAGAGGMPGGMGGMPGGMPGGAGASGAGGADPEIEEVD